MLKPILKIDYGKFIYFAKDYQIHVHQKLDALTKHNSQISCIHIFQEITHTAKVISSQVWSKVFFKTKFIKKYLFVECD